MEYCLVLEDKNYFNIPFNNSSCSATKDTAYQSISKVKFLVRFRKKLQKCQLVLKMNSELKGKKYIFLFIF